MGLLASILALLATTVPQGFLSFAHLSQGTPYFEWVWFMGGTDSSRWLGVNLGDSLDLASLVIGTIIYPIIAATAVIALASDSGKEESGEAGSGAIHNDSHMIDEV
jgi:hypothetical protein